MIYKLILIITLPISAHAAFEFQPIGAHTAGAGDTGVALATGASGAFWNPAALAWGKAIELVWHISPALWHSRTGNPCVQRGPADGASRPGREIYGIWICAIQRTGIWSRLWTARISTTEPGDSAYAPYN